MKNHRTHLNLTKMLLPGVSDDMINNINSAIDNPTESDMMFSQMMEATFGKGFKFPGMWQGGHRKYNHDLVSAMMIGMTQGGYNGMLIAMNHMMQDTVSDQMVSLLGMDGRDVMESTMLWLFGQR